MPKANWTTVEDEYIREHFPTKHSSCLVRNLHSISRNYRLPKEIATRHAILIAEDFAVAVNVCPECGEPESDEQKQGSLHCYNTTYDCGYETVHALSSGDLLEVTVECGGEPDQPRRFCIFNAIAALSPLQAVAESWASIDGKTPIYSVSGWEDGMTYSNGKKVTHARMNDYAEGYESDAHELIKRLEKRGYSIVKTAY